ncbi:MAG: hypothetical protein HQK49_10170 [Oligoflexia bacterium]|nr:hypothetical protein [Oligoflexia bacterium]
MELQDYDIVFVEYLKDYELKITFKNGKVGVLSMDKYFSKSNRCFIRFRCFMSTKILLNGKVKLLLALIVVFFCINCLLNASEQMKTKEAIITKQIDPAGIFESKEFQILRKKEGFIFHVLTTKTGDTLIIIGEKHIVDKSSTGYVKKVVELLENAKAVKSNDMEIYHEDPFHYSVPINQPELLIKPEDAKRSGGGALFLSGKNSLRPFASENSGILGEMSRCLQLTTSPLEIGQIPPIEEVIRNLQLKLEILSSKNKNKKNRTEEEEDKDDLEEAGLEAIIIRLADGTPKKNDPYIEKYDQRGRRMGETLFNGKNKVRYAIVGQRHADEMIKTLITLGANQIYP